MFYQTEATRGLHALLTMICCAGVVGVVYMVSTIVGASDDPKIVMLMLGACMIIAGSMLSWRDANLRRFRKSNGFGLVGFGFALFPTELPPVAQCLLIPLAGAVFVSVWAAGCDYRLRRSGPNFGIRVHAAWPVFGFGVLFQLLAEVGSSLSIDWWMIVGFILIGAFAGIPLGISWLINQEKRKTVRIPA